MTFCTETNQTKTSWQLVGRLVLEKIMFSVKITALLVSLCKSCHVTYLHNILKKTNQPWYLITRRHSNPGLLGRESHVWPIQQALTSPWLLWLFILLHQRVTSGVITVSYFEAQGHWPGCSVWCVGGENGLIISRSHHLYVSWLSCPEAKGGGSLDTAGQDGWQARDSRLNIRHLWAWNQRLQR